MNFTADVLSVWDFFYTQKGDPKPKAENRDANTSLPNIDQAKDASDVPVTGAQQGSLVNGNGKCMDLWDAASLNGRRVQLWDCTRTSGADGQSEPIEAQRVIFDQGKLSIEGKCLDVYQQRNANGTPVHLWDCVPAPTQQWKHLPDGQFQNVQTGKCLAVREDSSENGTVLHIWDCHPGQTEKWSFGR